MKYILNFKTCLFAVVLMMGASSCEDFLNRPDPAAYTLADFYKTDQQLLQAANILYNSSWHDFTRGYIGVGDTQAGNHYSSGSGFWTLNHNSSDIEQTLSNMAAALWSVNARVNTTLENFRMYAGSATTEAGLNTAKGEVLVWKAMAYFYLVRTYGAVPIIHDNSEMMASGNYNVVLKAKVENVYEYIIMTLEQAIRWLPEHNAEGRIDRYSAYGLLAKVYLTKSGYGQSGSRNQEDLDKAEEYAYEVVHNSGRILEPVYADIFRGSKNKGPEGLISWHWTTNGDAWTAANPLQSDLAMGGFDEHGGGWGDWGGPSVDLQKAFGEDATKLTRNNTDSRRKATMMMYGDVYTGYFWRDNPTIDGVAFPDGFDYTMYRRDVVGNFASSTGANAVKHLVGNSTDHQAEGMGTMPRQMVAGNATHILRLADVYLVYAEAILGNNGSTADTEALYAFNAVRARAGLTTPKTSLTFDDIFKERRLELAYEGDNWYDFVRLAYYAPEDALARLKAQERRGYAGLAGGEGAYLFEGVEGVTVGADGKPTPRINDEENTGQNSWTADVFTIPFPDTDVQMNPNMGDNVEPVEVNVREEYKYE